MTRLPLKSRLQQATSRRGGFTLIELLGVIIIISILVALLVPAVMGGFKKVRIAGVRTEISQMESAIGRFKANSSIDPPSFMFICETANDWTLPANASFRATIRTIWPQFDFTYSAFGGQIDLNGDGASTGVTLSNGECLVFFLGGINATNAPGAANIGACTGFSKNPSSPFSSGGNRDAPLFEFLPARFTDVDNDGMPEYRDALPGQTQPYLYYSSYGGQGYRVGEFGGGALTEPYRQGTASTQAPWKQNSFQIISPGYDKSYGFGGAYVTTGSNRLLIDPTAYPNSFASTAPTAQQRTFEEDNITNFSDGQLVP
jgi:prepilin-type N-terminal cleavage/methylation domain-containing protein